MIDLFDDFRQRMLAGLNWTSLSLVMLAFDDPYTFDPTDLTQASLGVTPVAVSQAITGLATTGGYAKSNAVSFTTIPVGDPLTFMVLAEANATPANRRLICYCNEGQGFPFTPNGLQRIVQPDWFQGRGWFRP